MPKTKDDKTDRNGMGHTEKARGGRGGVQGWGNEATPHKTVGRENLSINHERHVVLSGRTAERENNYRYECSAYAPVHTPLPPSPLGGLTNSCHNTSEPASWPHPVTAHSLPPVRHAGLTDSH